MILWWLIALLVIAKWGGWTQIEWLEIALFSAVFIIIRGVDEHSVKTTEKIQQLTKRTADVENKLKYQSGNQLDELSQEIDSIKGQLCTVEDSVSEIENNITLLEADLSDKGAI